MDGRQAAPIIARRDMDNLDAIMPARAPGRHQQQGILRPGTIPPAMAVPERRFAAFKEHLGQGFDQPIPGQRRPDCCLVHLPHGFASAILLAHVALPGGEGQALARELLSFRMASPLPNRRTAFDQAISRRASHARAGQCRWADVRRLRGWPAIR